MAATAIGSVVRHWKKRKSKAVSVVMIDGTSPVTFFFFVHYLWSATLTYDPKFSQFFLLLLPLLLRSKGSSARVRSAFAWCFAVAVAASVMDLHQDGA